jgi:hypothetical protein
MVHDWLLIIHNGTDRNVVTYSIFQHYFQTLMNSPKRIFSFLGSSSAGKGQFQKENTTSPQYLLNDWPIPASNPNGLD